MINVTTHILKFRKFLLDSWDDIDALMDDHDWDDDIDFIHEWLQCNWEFLVERQLLKKEGFINSFGFGFKKGRITYEKAAITHEIICLSKKNVLLFDDKTKKEIPPNTRLVFYSFFKKMGRSYGFYPPFDYAEVFVKEEKKTSRYIVPVNDVEFFLDDVVNENLPVSAS